MKQATETSCSSYQISDLKNKHFKVATPNIFKEPKETMIKEVKEGMMTMLYQMQTNGNSGIEKFNNWNEKFMSMS